MHQSLQLLPREQPADHLCLEAEGTEGADARSGGQENQPHIQVAMAVRAQEGLEELSTLKIMFLLGLPRSSSRQRGPGVLPAVLQRIHSPKGAGGLVPDLGRLSQQSHCVSLPLPFPSAPLLTPGAECGRRWTLELQEGPLRRGEDRPGPSSLVALVLLLRATPTPHSVNPQRTSGCEV